MEKERIKRNNGRSDRNTKSKERQDCPAVTIPFNPYKSVYRQDYVPQTYLKAESFRVGSWYEGKRNNPHPDEIFMVHHLSRKEAKRVPTPFLYWKRRPSEKEIRKILSGDFSTEYQEKFSARKEGLVSKPILPRPVEQKKQISHPLITEFQDQYRLPFLNNDVMINTARNGSNAIRDIPPKGIIPAVTYAHIRNEENRKKVTTYKEDYGNVYDGLASILKSMDIQGIERELQNSDPKERKALRRFLESVTKACIIKPMKSKIC
ncbi:testis-expressed protein 26-like [Heptranchias perlo]|uniref:testis-expressed protein 26-like n=1 Tax=Heptranchias perlo TaxID=212740 RepID=UPI003559FE4E